MYLFVGLEDVALEDVAGAVARDVAEDVEVLRVVRHVEDPVQQANTILQYVSIHVVYG